MSTAEQIILFHSRGSQSAAAQHKKVTAYADGGEILAGEFNQRVYDIANYLLQRREQRWALVCDDTLWFALGFMALAHAHKTVVLPQANGAANVAETKAEALLTDCPARFQFPVNLDVTSAVEPGKPADMPLDERLLVELYTSGTTGVPKRANKLLGQLLAEVAALEEQWGKMLGDATVLATVPHYHLYGLLFRVLWPLWAARPFYTLTCKQPFEFNAAARRFGRCVIISSPAFLTRITDFKSLQPAKVFGAIFSSGAALPEIAAEKIANEWGIAPIEVYGSTETGGIAWRTWEPGVGQTAWQPFKSVEVAAPEVEGGSLCVRSAWTWQTDWVDTGDLARVLTQGRFLLCGRADSVLKVEDKRISLTEMEARLVAHTLVNEVRLLILKSKRTSIGAVVVLSPAGRRRLKQAGTVKMRKLLMDSLRAWYEPVLLPRKWRFVQRLPDDAMGKVGMRALRALFTERP